MGIFKQPKAPAPFDAAGNLQKQDTANQEKVAQDITTNRPNQYGPFGSVTWSQNPDGSFSQSTTLNPDELAKRDQMWGMGSAAYQGGLSALGNSSNLDPSLTDPTGLLHAGAGNLYGMSQSPFVAPDWQQGADRATEYMRLTQGEQRDALDNKLRNQGLDPSSDAYKGAMRDQKVAGDYAVGNATAGVQNQLYNQALGARGQAYQEGAGMLSAGLGVGQQDWNQKYGLAGLGSQDAARMAQLGLSGMPAIATSPGVSSFNSVGIPGLDVMGAYQNQYNSQMDQYKQQMAQYNAGMGGMAALGGTALQYGLPLMLSDARAKRDIKKVGALDSGLPIYSYRYAGSPRTEVGVMAQEAERVVPDAVTEIGGLKHVDYKRLMDVLA